MKQLKETIQPMAHKQMFILVVCFVLFGAAIPGYGNSRKSPDLNWCSSGSRSLTERFGDHYYQVMNRLDSETEGLDTFLYTIAEPPLSKKQIIKKIGLP